MSAPPKVLIRGDGVAAACTAHLLRRSGIAVRTEPSGRPRVPAILLSEAALALIRDVFDRPRLLAEAPRIDRRVVAWGPGSAAVAVPHPAVMASEAALLAALSPDEAPGFAGAPDFVVHAAAPPDSGQMRFGAYEAMAAEVRLTDPADLSACWIEALDQGWLFLAPNSAGSSWLLAVGAPLEPLLAASRLIAPRIALAGPRSSVFEACPRIAVPAAGEDWLACGTAAVAFDPICGDGAAQAVREAVLAAAVIVAIAEGGDAPALLGHYQSMLVAAIRRHLQLCAGYYSTGGDGAWWSRTYEALLEGHRWCTAKLATTPEPRFVLRGFRLEPREAVA